MISSWSEAKPRSSEFDEFLALYSSFALGKTSYLARLEFKLQKIWDSYDMAKKKDFTDRLVLVGVLGEEAELGIRMFGGTITKIA